MPAQFINVTVAGEMAVLPVSEYQGLIDAQANSATTIAALESSLLSAEQRIAEINNSLTVLSNSVTGIEADVILLDDRLDVLELSSSPTAPTHGPNIVKNGDFAVDAEWSKGTGWTIANDTASRGVSTGLLVQTLPGLPGKNWLVEFDILESNGANILARFGGGTAVNGPNMNTTGHYSTVLTGGTGSTSIGIQPSSGWAGKIDNVSVREVL